ncbi:unnamed protein product [Urochloa humidicola]
MHPARLLLLLLAVSSLGAATAYDDRPPLFMNRTCSGNYTDSSPYGKNVAELRSALSTPPPATAGNHWWFRSHTVGEASGLAVCYADADAKQCLGCLDSVNSTWFSLVCHYSRSVGFLESVGCAVRYADAPFFGSADSGAGARLVLRSDVSAYGPAAAAMRDARRALLSQLAESAGGDALRFAAGSQGYNDTDTTDGGGRWQVMYGMAQCTRDLPPSECSSCLVGLLAAMYGDVSVTNSTSARLMGLSCYLRYQINNPISFIAGMVPAVPPAAPPTGSAAAALPTPLLAALLAATAVTLFSRAV